LGEQDKAVMMQQTRSRGNAASIVLPVATAVAALAIFVFDTMMGIEVAAAGLYVVVVLMAARFLDANGVIWVGFGCVCLTVFELHAFAARDRQSGGDSESADLSRRYRLDDLSRRADTESRRRVARAGQPP
jgi:hypothetical protein